MLSKLPTTSTLNARKPQCSSTYVLEPSAKAQACSQCTPKQQRDASAKLQQTSARMWRVMVRTYQTHNVLWTRIKSLTTSFDMQSLKLLVYLIIIMHLLLADMVGNCCGSFDSDPLTSEKFVTCLRCCVVVWFGIK